MKKLFCFILSLIFVFGFQLTFVFAQPSQPAATGSTPDLGQSIGGQLNTFGQNVYGPNATAQPLPVIIARIVRSALAIFGMIILGYILYAGYQWMTAGGDEKKVQSAKDHIKNAAIGLAIVLSSMAIASFIVSSLSQATLSTGQIK